MLAEWRADGFGHDELELWVMGYAGSEEHVEELEAGSDASIFADSTLDAENAMLLYDAHVNDLFLVDRQGRLAGQTNASVDPLGVEENRSALDEWVRLLLAE